MDTPADGPITRSSLRIRRRSLTSARAHRSAMELRDHLVILPELRRAHRVAASLADDGEIDLGPTIDALWRRGVEVSVPVVDGPSAMQFRVLEPDDPTAVGAFGIREPTSGAVRDVALFDVVILPAVAVDSNGNRLGRGRGYYDRALAAHEAGVAPFLIAAVHHLQIVDRLTPGGQDVPVDIIVSERGSLHITNPGQD